MEVHGRELGRCRIGHVDVQRLRLVDIRAAVRRHVQHDPLLDLPHGLVKLLDLCWKIEELHTAVAGDELIPHVIGPKPTLDEVPEEMPVHLHKLPREHPAYIEVLRVGLEGLIVAEDLRCACSGHWCHQERVAEAVLSDLRLQAIPVPKPALRFDAPEVELQLSLARRRPREGLIGAEALSFLARGLTGRKVDGLEDILVQPLCSLALERQAHDEERIGQALDTEAHRPVTHVRIPGLWHRVVVPIDDPVEVPCRHLHHFVEGLEVVRLLCPSKGRQRD
mmetsp:Transcript_108018/g.220529  ORF Transcript_108018/g.220529 Transcript_108018/m.220529 type:complete len:279 (+) Transcript_108018:406-1242(+)